MLAPSQADDVPRAQRPSQSPAVTALPKGEPRHRILAQEMERICIDTLHSPVYGYPSMRVPPESRMVVKRFPSRHPLPLPVGEVASAARTGRANNGNVNPGKCWHLRRQMTSRGRKALSVTCGDSSPKGRAKASYIGTRNGAYLYRYAPFTVYSYPSMRVPPESRMVVKRFPSPAPLASPCGRGGQRSEDGEGQITATSIGKCWHLRRQMTSRGRKALSVTCGDSSPKGSQGIVYWHKKWSVSVSIRSIHCFTATPQCACRPKVGWS